MGTEIFNWFTKITGYPVQKLIFRTRIFYEKQEIQGRKLRGPVMVICNHTAVYDFAALMFVFFGRTLRTLMAEVLFEKKKQPLGLFLKALGGIRVDRDSFAMPFIQESVDLLEEGKALLVFPESRIPLSEEERPLPFKTSAALIALQAGVPVIPVFTDGNYFGRGHAHVMIGTPVDARALTDDSLSDRENIARVSTAFRDRVISLGRMLEEEKEKERRNELR